MQSQFHQPHHMLQTSAMHPPATSVPLSLTPSSVQHQHAPHAHGYPPSPFWNPHHPQARLQTAPTSPSQVTNPSPSGYQVVMTQSAHPNPRPRKPYTTTKVREMWSPSEHERMLEGLRMFKRDWAKVTRFVGTRSAAQVRSHAQKYFDKVARDKTDDFVPRPRPKRKSATPYPRKPREESQPVAVAVPVPVPVTPTSVSVPVHHVIPVQQPISHTSSPYIQPAPSPSLFSSPNPHHHTQTNASPIPFVSPAHFQQSPNLNTLSHHPTQLSPHMYSVFSPLTPFQQQTAQQSAQFISPSGYISSSSPSITMAQLSPRQDQLPVPHPVVNGSPSMYGIPSHTHPDGKSDNCAKCNALKRYGTVFHELRSVAPARSLLEHREKVTVAETTNSGDQHVNSKSKSETSTAETNKDHSGSERDNEIRTQVSKKRKVKGDEKGETARVVRQKVDKSEKGGSKVKRAKGGKQKKKSHSSSQVDSYSSSEQREIYDAVQSLQILSNRTTEEHPVGHCSPFDHCSPLSPSNKDN